MHTFENGYFLNLTSADKKQVKQCHLAAEQTASSSRWDEDQNTFDLECHLQNMPVSKNRIFRLKISVHSEVKLIQQDIPCLKMAN